ncbi:CHAP domain-containing protein [uncultured Oscillibacter sp.]|uniref:CHAP domain-containing protein n=1 Tax=uncultured Oscillibacter sp. TaxID=876091 RepID=UPI0025DC0DFB|nr:CHAP domain-containing protein [uncultured Oscillibacter sp.]
MTAEKVLAVARGELGNTESPAGSNRTKYGKWFGLDGYAWCMMFVMWCFSQVVALKLLPKRTASCGDLMRAAKAAGCWVTKDYRPGDVVIYDFPGGAATDHTGIIEKVTLTGVVAIEGNTSEAGSQSNGGMVCRKTRPYSQIVGVVRPNYQKEDKRMDNTPSPAHKEGVDWAKKNSILTGDSSGDLKLSQPVTRQQLCSMLYRFAKKTGKI